MQKASSHHVHSTSSMFTHHRSTLLTHLTDLAHNELNKLIKQMVGAEWTWLLHIVGIWFQVLFHSPSRGSFHLSLAVLVHYRLPRSI